ncbi:MAG: TIGR02466 family protein [Pseudomonadota bacterium]|nr:TIGR02466 family protein [Pseudomonadota bacterium]
MPGRKPAAPAATARVAALFPTLIYHAPLKTRGVTSLNRELEREAHQLRDHDVVGRRWSGKAYPGGYTSYASLDQLHQMSSTFFDVRAAIDRHVRAYARALHWDLGEARLQMTDCWINIMGPLCAHGAHVHPHAVVSGTYYVKTPAKSSGLRFEDPRLASFMAAPARTDDAPEPMRHHVTYPARAGWLTLFESWQRHEVPPSLASDERISISFNYAWV